MSNQYSSSATEILPGLWLGDLKSSLDIGFLNDKQIQCIINCTDRYPFSDQVSIKVKYRLPVKDNLEQEEIDKLYEHLDEIVDLIQHWIKSYNILIHCYAGKQRSAAVVIAYLIKYGLMDLESSIVAIKSKKPDVFEPTFNFESALKLYWLKLNEIEQVKTELQLINY
jgi:dual specificity phosphatase 12